MLTLICGCSRAGKTTYSKKYDDVIHLDGLAKKLADRYAMALSMARTDKNLVFDGIYDRADLRSALVDAYQGDTCICVWIDTTRDVIRSRIKIPYPHNTFEPPTFEEGWDEIIRINR